MTTPRRWVRRAALSMLAGGGLGAAGLAASAGALGAETATTSAPGSETPSPPVTETTPKSSAPEPSSGSQPAEPPASTTPTSAAPSPPSATSTGTSTTSTDATAPTPAAQTPQAPAASGERTTSAPTVVVQRKQRPTRNRRNPNTNASSTNPGGAPPSQPSSGAGAKHGPASVPPGAPNGVAPAPQAVGGEAGSLATLLASSAVSVQALDFYRVPMFLLPIYQAAAVQYDVPWQILAAVNEVETDFGTDLSVSTAGAVGWMQFMPATWLQYGVDATDAGYADPYNPVDAIFAAARYLHAAGASQNLHRAILAYNHSQAYVESVLLRARLIASYPRSVIGTLTGLVDARLPTAGAHAAAGTVYAPSLAPEAPAGSAAGAGTESAGASSATAGAVPASPLVAGATALHGTTAGASAPANAARHAGDAVPGHGSPLPGSTPPPPPLVVARRAEVAADAPARPSQLMQLDGRPGAPVVAVQDGRIVHLGDSRALGRYLVLRDVDGDIFTYAGLGSIAPRYPRPKPPANLAQHTPGSAARTANAGDGGSHGAQEPSADPAPTLAATAGHQTPTTLSVKTQARSAAATPPAEPEAESAPAGTGKVRMYAHPGNPLARAAAARAKAGDLHGRWLPLRTGALVSQGTVLGHLASDPAPDAGKLSFAVRPAGDNGTVDPRPLLANWRQLAIALHPRGTRDVVQLLGATAQEVFAMSKSELQRSVLSDPRIQLDACGMRDVQEGAIDRRALGVLEFLARSGLQPTVGALRCARGRTTAAGPVFEHFAGGTIDITAINGTPIAGHQGPGTITDTTIRALLTLRGQWLPSRIYSLMEYPHTPSTRAHAADWNRIRIAFGAVVASGRASQARAARAASSPLSDAGDLSRAQWNSLIARIAAIPQPTVSANPSSSAIRDPLATRANRG